MKASFGAHLAEGRRRLIHVLIIFALATVLSYPLAKPLLAKVKSDLLGDVELVVLGPQEALMAYLRVSVLMGFALTLPFMMYHLWVFTAPGLLKHERGLILYLVVPSILLFTLGVGFGYFIMLPIALKFLLASAVGLATPMLSLGTTFSFITSILLTLGIIFQLPLVTAALTKLGLVDHRLLSSYRRHAIVLIFLAAALLTDPSVITQLILAAPMVLLYELGIITSWMVGGKR